MIDHDSPVPVQEPPTTPERPSPGSPADPQPQPRPLPPVDVPPKPLNEPPPMGDPVGP